MHSESVPLLPWGCPFVHVWGEGVPRLSKGRRANPHSVTVSAIICNAPAPATPVSGGCAYQSGFPALSTCSLHIRQVYHTKREPGLPSGARPPTDDRGYVLSRDPCSQ